MTKGYESKGRTINSSLVAFRQVTGESHSDPSESPRDEIGASARYRRLWEGA
jgi:hypothetical protein